LSTAARLNLAAKILGRLAERRSLSALESGQAAVKGGAMLIMAHTTSLLEYSAVRDGGAGLLDLSSRGRILVSGSEAIMFLNGLITNDMKTLGVNSWMPAILPNVQGRLLAAVRIIHRDDGFLIDTESATHDKVVSLLDRFTMAGDFRLTDLTAQTASYSVQGAKAAEVVRGVLGEAAANLEPRRAVTAGLAGRKVNVIRATHTAEDGFDLFVDANDAQQVRDSLIAGGAKPINEEVAETLRIEAGIPRYGIDMDETTVVTETNLDEAVSFTKGCYVGQEIIVRIKHRGHVAKKMTGITLEEKSELENGAQILSAEDKEIGRIRSSTFSPRLGRTIALGYLKYDFLKPGTDVRIQSNSSRLTGTVAELPFIRGSWYTV
jgi:folate-binding protein YgfZ